MQFLLVLISGFKDLNHSQDIGYHKIFLHFFTKYKNEWKGHKF